MALRQRPQPKIRAAGPPLRPAAPEPERPRLTGPQQVTAGKLDGPSAAHVLGKRLPGRITTHLPYKRKSVEPLRPALRNRNTPIRHNGQRQATDGSHAPVRRTGGNSTDRRGRSSASRPPPGRPVPRSPVSDEISACGNLQIPNNVVNLGRRTDKSIRFKLQISLKL